MLLIVNIPPPPHPRHRGKRLPWRRLIMAHCGLCQSQRSCSNFLRVRNQQNVRLLHQWIYCEAKEVDSFGPTARTGSWESRTRWELLCPSVWGVRVAVMSILMEALLVTHLKNKQTKKRPPKKNLRGWRPESSRLQ